MLFKRFALGTENVWLDIRVSLSFWRRAV